MKKSMLFLAIMLGVMLLAAACASNDNQGSSAGADSNEPANNAEAPPAEAENPDPVELTFFYPYQGSYTDESFMDIYGSAIKAEYPHFDLKLIIGGGEGTKIDELLTIRTPIDIIFTSIGATHEFLIDTKLNYDITPQIKKFGYDLDRLDPGALGVARSAANNEGLYGLPVSNAASGLYYNKDVFDLFGVEYPKDGSTWDDIYNLSKDLTRMDGDEQYFGFATMFDHMMMLNQFALPIVQSDPLRSAMEREEWKPYIENLVRFYQLPGYETWERNDLNVNNQRSKFFKDRNVAMWLTPTSLYKAEDFGDMNWDLVSAPTFSHLPGVGPQAYPSYFYVTSISEHKDAAFQAISVLTTDEYQREKTLTGEIVPILNDDELKASFGQEGSVYAGKNVSALFPKENAATPDMNKYHFSLRWATNSNVLAPVILGEKDLNTALREVSDMINQNISQAEGITIK